MAAALESLRRLLETILVISARWSSEVGRLKYLSSSPVTRVRLATLNINIVVAAGLEYEESGCRWYAE